MNAVWYVILENKIMSIGQPGNNVQSQQGAPGTAKTSQTGEWRAPGGPLPAKIVIPENTMSSAMQDFDYRLNNLEIDSVKDRNVTVWDRGQTSSPKAQNDSGSSVDISLARGGRDDHHGYPGIGAQQNYHGVAPFPQFQTMGGQPYYHGYPGIGGQQNYYGVAPFPQFPTMGGQGNPGRSGGTGLPWFVTPISIESHGSLAGLPGTGSGGFGEVAGSQGRSPNSMATSSRGSRTYASDESSTAPYRSSGNRNVPGTGTKLSEEAKLQIRNKQLNPKRNKRYDWASWFPHAPRGCSRKRTTFPTPQGRTSRERSSLSPRLSITGSPRQRIWIILWLRSSSSKTSALCPIRTALIFQKNSPEVSMPRSLM
jgi:hypothetical protein